MPRLHEARLARVYGTTEEVMLEAQDLVGIACSLNHPVEGEFAEYLWRTCSSYWGLPVKLGHQVYVEAGYIPFSGYPLARSGHKCQLRPEDRPRFLEKWEKRKETHAEISVEEPARVA